MISISDSLSCDVREWVRSISTGECVRSIAVSVDWCCPVIAPWSGAGYRTPSSSWIPTRSPFSLTGDGAAVSLELVGDPGLGWNLGGGVEGFDVIVD